MDSLSCYIHEHELAHIDLDWYGLSDFEELPENPELERFLPMKGTQIPIYKLNRIAGTVLDRDKSKKTITLLTTTGVVTVRIYGNVFAQYDKQISVRGADGKKHILQKSWFSRGSKIIVVGIKQGETEFLAKKYSRTPFHLVEQITDVRPDGVMTTCGERPEVE